jgi:hypothetical protein
VRRSGLDRLVMLIKYTQTALRIGDTLTEASR